MSVPLAMDEIPSLPEPEGTILRNQLRQVWSIEFDSFKKFNSSFILRYYVNLNLNNIISLIFKLWKLVEKLKQSFILSEAFDMWLNS